MAGIWSIVSLVNSAKQTVGSIQKLQGQAEHYQQQFSEAQERLVQRDYERAVAGDAQAQYEMGERFFQGLGVTKEYAPAAAWFELAAKQGHPQAQRNLALMLFLGRGVAIDLAEAYKWICLAARRGQPDHVETRQKMASKIPPEAVQEGERRAAAFLAPR
jgi:TPR repeat protein